MAGYADWLDARWNEKHLRLGALPAIPLSTTLLKSSTVYVTEPPIQTVVNSGQETIMKLRHVLLHYGGTE
jgi:hypothetical protein